MLSRTLNQIDQSPWDKLVWAGVCVVALVQVVALYQLCTSQVARAQARETVAVEQRNALTDCLDYGQKSTISSCARARTTGRAAADAGSLANRDMPGAPFMGSMAPVSYVFN